MIFSSSEILPVVESTGFKEDVIEKVLHLLNLLTTLNSHPFLKGKLALKGGSALNLFVFDKQLVKECCDRLSVVLPFTDSEMEFLNLLLDQGEIVPSLLTSDKDLQERISRQPLLEWKALNVRKHMAKD